jgi:hypothetical protein
MPLAKPREPRPRHLRAARRAAARLRPILGEAVRVEVSTDSYNRPIARVSIVGVERDGAVVIGQSPVRLVWRCQHGEIATSYRHRGQIDAPRPRFFGCAECEPVRVGATVGGWRIVEIVSTGWHRRVRMRCAVCGARRSDRATLVRRGMETGRYVACLTCGGAS